MSLGPGRASLSGTATGPDGLLPAATVRIERFVGNAMASTELTTADDGTWALPNVLGGRYRVRAWRAPDLAQTKPDVFFIQSSEAKSVNLRVDRQTGIAVTSSIAPDPPYYGYPINLFVLVAQKSVDSRGVVQKAPVTGTPVDLSGYGAQLETGNPSITDGNGVAQWRYRCTTTGAPALSVSVSGVSYPLTVPPCVDPNAPPPPPPSSGSTTTSSTTVRRTTSTRR
jgi:hypothetical protein